MVHRLNPNAPEHLSGEIWRPDWNQTKAPWCASRRAADLTLSSSILALATRTCSKRTTPRTRPLPTSRHSRIDCSNWRSACVNGCFEHRFEQYLTVDQFRRHFLRHSKSRPQTRHSFDGNWGFRFVSMLFPWVVSDPK